MTMRMILFAAGAVACLALSACEKKATADAAATPAAEAPKKSYGRPAPHYAGQDRIRSIKSGTVEAAPDGGVILKVSGETDGPGYTQVGFLPYVYAATPPDGIYEIEVVAQAPAAPGAAAATPVEVKTPWSKYTDGRVKGVKFMSKTNEVVAMLPAKS
jgi:hypothetical protein